MGVVLRSAADLTYVSAPPSGIPAANAVQKRALGIDELSNAGPKAEGNPIEGLKEAGVFSRSSG